ncbi:hypothetical protein HP397_01600 [Streptobacillus felis]|uniref:Uncharacterized protein n=1 Tax=Streptobacillus felis TaxID=1384509 RepID=A0A7Z0PE02_9FUSO|nr:hypothetical protein [Streptobacillus felis]NYV27523.1 hypothetical protein [Streptobacillus felis]
MSEIPYDIDTEKFKSFEEKKREAEIFAEKISQKKNRVKYIEGTAYQNSINKSIINLGIRKILYKKYKHLPKYLAKKIEEYPIGINKKHQVGKVDSDANKYINEKKVK